MPSQLSREDRIARLIRAGELVVSGEAPEEAVDLFSPDFAFHGPDGMQTDRNGLLDYFASLRHAFDDRTIRRGIIVSEGGQLACQTWIEGTFTREFAQSPDGPIAPNGRRIVFDLMNIFEMDDAGRLTAEYVQTDNRSLVAQLRAEPVG